MSHLYPPPRTIHLNNNSNNIIAPCPTILEDRRLIDKLYVIIYVILQFIRSADVFGHLVVVLYIDRKEERQGKRSIAIISVCLILTPYATNAIVE